MAKIKKQAPIPLKRKDNALQSTLKRLKAIFCTPIPSKYLPMAQLLIVINLVVFIIQLYNPLFTEAFHYRSGVWYSYLTACFLHGNIAHIAGNMLFFSFIVPQIEEKYGSYFLLLAYCITGIIGSMLMAFFIPSVTALGASGSISGLMMIWVIHSLMESRPIVVLAALFWFIKEGVLSGVGLILPDGIGHLAHFGSAVGGILFIPYMCFKRK